VIRINTEEAIGRVTIGKKENKDQQGIKSARKSASQGYHDRLRPEQDNKNNKGRD
jgi:hypothetical protein